MKTNNIGNTGHSINFRKLAKPAVVFISRRERFSWKIYNVRNTLHSINLRKLAKPAGLCIIAIFIISMLSVFATSGVQAATTPALHTSGDQILNSNNNVVYFRGIGLATGESGAPDWIFWSPTTSPSTTVGATNGTFLKILQWNKAP